MWFLFAFLFINHASCCQEQQLQEQQLVERNLTKHDAELLFKYINDKCKERTRKANTRIRINRVEKALQSTLQTMRAMQLEAEINCMLNALLKGIAVR